MPEPTTFSKYTLNGRIYPLSYSVIRKYDIDVLYYTVASVADVYGFIRDKLKDFLYIFDAGHDMEKDGIYLTLKEVLESLKLDPAFIFDPETAAVKKEKFPKFLKFTQRDIKMFDHERLMSEDEFPGFFATSRERRRNDGTFLEMNSGSSRYYIDCHDNSLLYCETRDTELKTELLRKMLRNYFGAYLEKKYGSVCDLSLPPREIADELFKKWDKLKIREEDTVFKDDIITAAVFDPENEAGQVIYRAGKKEWAVKQA